MNRMECVLCQVGTEDVLTIQMEFMFQRATVGCKIVASLKKAIRIFGTQTEKTGSNPARSKKIFLFFKARRTAVGPTQPPVQWALEFFPGLKSAGT
jgi:hypothetical protein